MNELEVGMKAPGFSLPADDGRLVSLDDFLGKKVVLYFYPQDMSPTCTEQACQFRDRLEAFRRAGAEVNGISPDKPERHARVREKHGLTFLLLSEPAHETAEKYGVWLAKNVKGH